MFLDFTVLIIVCASLWVFREGFFHRQRDYHEFNLETGLGTRATPVVRVDIILAIGLGAREVFRLSSADADAIGILTGLAITLLFLGSPAISYSLGRVAGFCWNYAICLEWQRTGYWYG